MLPLHSTSNNTTYTCLSCQIQFPSTELQRSHMKTEWHRYNLKRRVAQLVPVSNEIFQLKVAHSKDRVKYDDFGFVIEEPVRHKPKGRKANNLRYDLLHRGRDVVNTHLSSRDSSPAASEISVFSLGTLNPNSDYDYDTDDLRSEISAATRLESDYHTEEDYVTDEYLTDNDEIEEDSEPLELNVCFYCGVPYDSIDDCISHMSLNHGLYIPESKFLADKEGLLRLLSDTVVLDKECLKCGFQSNKLVGIRQHIQAKGHACIPYETKEERILFRRFYDFCTENEEEDGDEDKNGDKAKNNDDYYDEEYTVAKIDPSGVELALPNGSRLGHRAMTKYYRQSFPRGERRLSEGERTVSAINNENERLLRVQETIKHNKEMKKISLIEGKITNRQLSQNSLQYRNNLEHYRNQRFG